jgi:DNA-binding GntR family transcriptional regulator
MSSPARESVVAMPTKTQQVIDYITEGIRAGAWPPKAKLPSASDLRAQFGVSQAVVRTAVDRLRAAGWVTTAPGAGWYVAEHPPIR